ncbi:MAG: hypothetical protein IPP90_20905 [Gemmatimonadaceae bacterium]|nr:hypothetical protein [Gemmatimonadaceae bacterium]
MTNVFRGSRARRDHVNMTSAYSGIRCRGQGAARVPVRAHAESHWRVPWGVPERFVENSPLFRTDRVTTPVLFMANDNDGAVPWYQGIEFYVGMRRLQKEACW